MTISVPNLQKIKELRGADSAEYRIVSDAMRIVWRGLLHVTQGIDPFAVNKNIFQLINWHLQYTCYKFIAEYRYPIATNYN